MQFPPFQVPYVGHGMIIGVNAIVHVVISHGFAIGLFAMLAIVDWKSLRAAPADRPPLDALARRMLRVLVLTTTLAGAVTGTGIWFTTSALASRGIASMLRIFFWAWFSEWIVFFVEVVAILVLYFAWDALERRRRLRIALSAAYAVTGFLSAFLITGNLGFMLTPGSWVESRGFFRAFFNPSFAPQLVARLAIAWVLGAIVAIVIAQTEPSRDWALRRRVTRWFGAALLAMVPVLALALVWYLVEVPRAFGERAAYAVLTERLTSHTWLFRIGNLVAAAAVVALAGAAALGRTRLTRALVVPAAVLTVGFVAEFERIREFIRGPYVMTGYMYVGGVLLEEQARFDERGLLSAGAWQEPYVRLAGARGAGAYLFAQNCSVCHTASGVNGIDRRVRDRSDDGLRVILRHTQELTSFMPPLVGSEEERMAVARFLHDMASGKAPLRQASRMMPVAPGGRR